MGPSRRTLIGLIGSLPFVGKTMGQHVMQNIKLQSIPTGPAGGYAGTFTANVLPTSPKMKSYEAWKILFQSKEIRDEYTSAIYAQYKDINQIDPDLAVLKSFSKMAKITFQRRRIVQRHIENTTNETGYEAINQKIQTYLDKLMWGK